MFLIYNRIFNFEINFIIENKNIKNNITLKKFYLYSNTLLNCFKKIVPILNTISLYNIFLLRKKYCLFIIFILFFHKNQNPIFIKNLEY